MWTMWDAPSDRDYYDQFMDPRELALLEQEDPDNELPEKCMYELKQNYPLADDDCPF